MQNLSLPIDVVLPHSVIGVFIVGSFLVGNGMVRYLEPFGIRSFDPEVICAYVTIKQGSHGRAAVGISHFVQQLHVQVVESLLNTVVESNHDYLGSFLGRQNPRWFAILATSAIWRKTFLRIARLSRLELSTGFN